MIQLFGLHFIQQIMKLQHLYQIVLLLYFLAITNDMKDSIMNDVDTKVTTQSHFSDMDLTSDGLLSSETIANTDPFEGLDTRRIGVPLPEEQGKWASCIRLVDSSFLTSSSSSSSSAAYMDSRTAHHVLELSENEAALSVATASFHDLGDEHFVFV